MPSASDRLRGLIVPEPPLSPRERVELALELGRVGEQLFVARLRRDQPAWTDAEVEDALIRWLTDRPLDHPGPMVSWSPTASKQR